MRVKIGRCRMPIGMCSEYRDKDCGKFCYYNTVGIQTNADRIRAMTDEELARMLFSLQVQTDVRGGIQSVEDWMKYLSQEYQKREWDT